MVLFYRLHYQRSIIIRDGFERRPSARSVSESDHLEIPKFHSDGPLDGRATSAIRNAGFMSSDVGFLQRAV
jgi:hypothetical protein